MTLSAVNAQYGPEVRICVCYIMIDANLSIAEHICTLVYLNLMLIDFRSTGKSTEKPNGDVSLKVSSWEY